MKTFRLARETVVPRDLGGTFAFFASPKNLEELTPPWLRIQVVSASDDPIQEGTTIDYKLRLRGIPLRWTSLISLWRPPVRFVDEQVRGPYRRWIHTHGFEPTDKGTRVTDEVEYAVLGGALVDRLLVRRDLERIFAFRSERLSQLLG
jgi:ligand-binding SRPBCC domain-containing protein